MADVLMVAVTIGFFLICVAYVSWCGRIIGPDPDGETDSTGDAGVAGTDREHELVAP